MTKFTRDEAREQLVSIVYFRHSMSMSYLKFMLLVKIRSNKAAWDVYWTAIVKLNTINLWKSWNLLTTERQLAHCVQVLKERVKQMVQAVIQKKRAREQELVKKQRDTLNN